MTSLRAIYQLRLTLAGVMPPISRGLQVSEDTTLPQLHRYIQAVMNWEHCHLHEFVASGRVYAEPDPELDDLDRKSVDERRVKISRLLKRVGDTCEYMYDFGDGWEHDILLEATLLPDPGAPYPRCISAARNAPPEDCGGPAGYMSYLEALADRMHPQHKEMRDWRGRFDPEYCSVDLLNERLRVAAKSSRMPALEPVYVSPYERTSARGIEIEFSDRERDLVMNHTLADESLVHTLHAKSKGRYRFSWEELDDLAGYIAVEAKQSRNRKLQQEWERIYAKVAGALDSSSARA